MNYRSKHIKPKIRALKRKKIAKWPWVLAFILIISLGAIAAYFALFYPKFRVSSIEVSGNQKVKEDDIKNFVKANTSDRILIFDKNKLEKNILNNFPGIKSVVIQKKYPNTVALKIEEREPSAVFCELKCFSMDGEGTIFEELKDTPKEMLIVRQELNDKEIYLGEKVIEKNILDEISSVQKNLKDNQIDIKEVFVSNPLIFTTSENWKIYFDPTSDINSQIAKMNLLLKSEITPNERKNLQYLYLQYQDRAYYK